MKLFSCQGFLFSKIEISGIDIQIYGNIIQLIQLKDLQENQLKSCWDLRVHSESVGIKVKIKKNDQIEKL